MAYLRYFRRVRLAPGLTLNLARRGASLSLGVRGAHVTLGRDGVRRTVGIPGTGVFYTSRRGWHTGVHSAPQFAPALAEHPEDRRMERALKLGVAGFLAACLLLAAVMLLLAWLVR